MQAIFVRNNERFVWSLAMDSLQRCQPCKSTKWIVCYSRKLRKNCVFRHSFFHVSLVHEMFAQQAFISKCFLLLILFGVFGIQFSARAARVLPLLILLHSFGAVILKWRQFRTRSARLDPSDWRENLEFAICLNISAARKITNREAPKSIGVLYFALSLFGVQFIVSMTLVRTRSTLSALHTQSQCQGRAGKAKRNMLSICSLFLIRRNWHHFKHDEQEGNLPLQHKPRMSRAKMSQHRKNTTPKQSKKMCLSLIFHFVSIHFRCFLDMNRDYLMLRFPCLCRFELSFRRAKKKCHVVFRGEMREIRRREKMGEKIIIIAGGPMMIERQQKRHILPSSFVIRANRVTRSLALSSVSFSSYAASY